MPRHCTDFNPKKLLFSVADFNMKNVVFDVKYNSRFSGAPGAYRYRKLYLVHADENFL